PTVASSQRSVLGAEHSLSRAERTLLVPELAHALPDLARFLHGRPVADDVLGATAAEPETRLAVVAQLTGARHVVARSRHRRFAIGVEDDECRVIRWLLRLR